MNANLFTKKIEMSKSEAKAAGKLNSNEFKNLRQLMELYPSFEIQIKAPSKRKAEFRGLNYKYMENYIQKCNRDDKAAILDEFHKMIALDKKNGVEGAELQQAANYLVVKKWFLAKFPEIKEHNDAHKQKVREILKAA